MAQVPGELIVRLDMDVATKALFNIRALAETEGSAEDPGRALVLIHQMADEALRKAEVKWPS